MMNLYYRITNIRDMKTKRLSNFIGKLELIDDNVLS